MKITAVLDQTAFEGLADTTVLGKDAYIKDEKTGSFMLAMDGEEAGKLAKPLQLRFDNKKAELDKVHEEKNGIAAKLKTFEDLGKTPEELKTIAETGKPANAQELENSYNAKLDSAKAEYERQIAAARTELETANGKAGELGKQLQGQMLSTEIERLKNKFEGNALADDFLRSRLQVVPEAEGSDKLAVRVFENGEFAYKATLPKTAEQLMEEAKANPDFAGMFTAGSGGGSGAPTKQAQGSPTGGFVKAGDKAAMEANIEDLASGKLKVV